MINRVLIIEEDSLIAETNRNYTERNRNYSVVGIFSSATLAMEYLRNNPVDLILLGHTQSKLNGFNFLKQLRREGYQTAVILLSAVNDAEHIFRLFSYGLLDYMILPVDYMRFQNALSKYAAYHEAELQNTRFTQQALDKLFRSNSRDSSFSVERGVQTVTLARVSAYLQANSGTPLTSEDIAKEIGVSRVTVRRYMQYLVQKGAVTISVDYSTGGRPSTIFTYQSDVAQIGE